MPNIPTLNYYDTDAVKAFVLDILVENKQLHQSLESELKSSSTWFNSYQAQKERADAAEAQVAELKGLADSLTAEQDAAMERGSSK